VKQRRVIGILLTTSSVAAVVAATSHPAQAACTTVTNTAGNYNVVGSPTCVILNGATVTGDVVNTVTISPGEAGNTFGIKLQSGTVGGAVVNTGTISLTVNGGAGILISPSGTLTLTGGVTNTGTITSSGTTGRGIAVLSDPTFTGGITNSGTISTRSNAIRVDTVSTFSGNISNSGSLSITLNTVAALFVLNTTTFAGSIANSGTITTPTGPNPLGIRVSNVGTITGNVTNSGTITSRSDISIEAFGTLAGGVTNTGTIAADNRGIVILNGTSFGGGILNSGSITATNSNGIRVTNIGTISGGIANLGGTISSRSNSIYVVNGTSFSGGISNSGTITSSNADGIRINNVTFVSGNIANSGSITAASPAISIGSVSIFTGSVTNTGSIISQNSVAVFVNGVSTFTGTIANSGTITSTNSAGIGVNNVSLFQNGVVNNASISARTAGIYATNVSQFSGGILNNGAITSQNSAGIYVATVASFQGGIANTGTILAASTGIFVQSGAGSTFSGGITNSGSISADVGIRVTGGGSFSGAIVNSGNITGTGGRAIDLDSAPSAMTINQLGGTITGAIRLSPFADVLNIMGGAIAGNIVGSGSSDTVNFALGTGTFTYSNTISGVNAVNVSSGTVILNGVLTTNTLTVTGARLEVGDAAHPGAIATATSLVLGTGGILSGYGTIAAPVTVGSGGVFAPGGSIGTTNVAGPVAFAAGSTYQVEINAAGQSDKIVATGAATLSGGTVQVLPAAGVYGPSTTYTILTAAGGVASQFADVSGGTAFFKPSLSYQSQAVTLTVNVLPFGAAAQTLNQLGVANALGSGSGSALGAAVFNLPTFGDARLAYDALSGEIAGSMHSMLIDDARFVRQAMLSRLRSASYSGGGGAGASGDAGALAYGGPELAYAATAPILKAPPFKAAPPDYDLVAWGQAFGDWGRFDGDGNAAEARRNIGGLVTGFDGRFGDGWRAGLMGGYSHSRLDVDARASTGQADSFHVGGYAGTRTGPWSLRSGVAFTWHDIDTSRTIAFPGFNDSAHASYGARALQAFGEIGYATSLGSIAAEPFAGIAVVNLHTDGFLETGGIAALAGAPTTTQVGYSTIGLRVATSMALPGGTTLIPRGSVAWQHAFDDVVPTAALALINTGGTFTVAGAPLARDAALVEAGFDLRLWPQVTFGVSYSGQLAGSVQDHAVKGQFSAKF
jgi:outer membrane autotransporter protein